MLQSTERLSNKDGLSGVWVFMDLPGRGNNIDFAGTLWQVVVSTGGSEREGSNVGREHRRDTWNWGHGRGDVET